MSWDSFGGMGRLGLLALLSSAELPKGLWKEKHVARYLGVHPKTIRLLRRDEGLPCLYIGGSVRFDPVAVTSWAKARQEVR